MYARHEAAQTRSNAGGSRVPVLVAAVVVTACVTTSCTNPGGHHDHRRTGFVPQRHGGRDVNHTHRWVQVRLITLVTAQTALNHSCAYRSR